MDRIPVDRIGIDLLVVVEDAVSPEGAGAYDVPVGEDVAPLGVDDEAGGLGVQGGVGVEGAGLAEADGNDVAHDVLDGLLPFGGVGPHGGEGLQDGLLDVVVAHVEVGGFHVGGVVAGGHFAVEREAVVL